MCLTREIAKFSQARNNYECFKMQRRGGSIISLSFTALLWVLRIPQLIPTGAPSWPAGTLSRWWRPSLHFLSHRHCLWELGAFRKSWESPGTFPPVLGGPQGGSVVPTAEMGRMTVSPEWSWSQWCRSAQWTVGGRWLRTGLTAAAQTFYFLSTTAVLGRHLFGKGQNFAKCKISFPFWRRMVEMFAQEK